MGSNYTYMYGREKLSMVLTIFQGLPLQRVFFMYECICINVVPGKQAKNADSIIFRDLEGEICVQSCRLSGYYPV
jgi:hypothetical protein